MKDGKTHCDDAHCFLKPPFFGFCFLLLPPPSWVFVIRGYKKSTNTTKKSAAVKVHPRVSQSGHACNFKTCYEKWPHVQLSWWRKFAVEKIFLDLDASSFISAVKLGILTHGLTHFWSQTQGTADFGPFFQSWRLLHDDRRVCYHTVSLERISRSEQKRATKCQGWPEVPPEEASSVI